MIEEVERSLHDALCVVRCLIKNNRIIPGGGAIEVNLGRKTEEYSQLLRKENSIVVKKFAEAFDQIPMILAQNMGLNPIETLTQLKGMQQGGNENAGLDSKLSAIVENTLEEKILMPVTVVENILILATECVRMILKIDDILTSRN